MTGLLAWAALLVAQNACFTWVSRARNSGSDWYHAVAAVFSNGVWFAAIFFTFDYLDRIQQGGVREALTFGGVYIAATVFGSVVAGKFLRRYFERGARRVGHYDTRS